MLLNPLQILGNGGVDDIFEPFLTPGGITWGFALGKAMPDVGLGWGPLVGCHLQ